MTDSFASRLAKVRARFVASLEGKIQDTYTALPRLSGGAASVDDLAETYRRIHGICGVAETVGFIETGRAARELDTLLLVAQRAQRGLTQEEVMPVRKALHALREAAAVELQTAFVVLRKTAVA